MTTWVADPLDTMQYSYKVLLILHFIISKKDSDIKCVQHHSALGVIMKIDDQGHSVLVSTVC